MQPQGRSQHGHGMPVLVVVVMGVSGCGKSTVGKLLAEKIGCDFLEGDSAHPASNIAKMQSGVPLTDADRMPWLLAIHSIMKEHLSTGRRLVVSCSALKPVYRRILLHGTHHVPGNGGEAPPTADATATATVTSGTTATAPTTHPDGDDNDRAAVQAPDSDARPAHPARDGCPGSAPLQRWHASGGNPPPPPAVAFVLLEPPPAELRRRLYERERAVGHFMPASLLDSQLATLSYSEDELFAHFRGESGVCCRSSGRGCGGKDGGAASDGGGGGGDENRRPAAGGCAGDGACAGGNKEDGDDGGYGRSNGAFPQDPHSIVEELRRLLLP